MAGLKQQLRKCNSVQELHPLLVKVAQYKGMSPKTARRCHREIKRIVKK